MLASKIFPSWRIERPATHLFELHDSESSLDDLPRVPQIVLVALGDTPA